MVYLLLAETPSRLDIRGTPLDSVGTCISLRLDLSGVVKEKRDVLSSTLALFDVEAEGIWSSLSASSPVGVGPAFRVGNRSSRFSLDTGKIKPYPSSQVK